MSYADGSYLASVVVLDRQDQRAMHHRYDVGGDLIYVHTHSNAAPVRSAGIKMYLLLRKNLRIRVESGS